MEITDFRKIKKKRVMQEVLSLHDILFYNKIKIKQLLLKIRKIVYKIEISIPVTVQ